MREGMNKVILAGNVGQEPDYAYTAGGSVRLTFSVATNERRKNRQGTYEDHTEWHRMTVFGARAEGLAKVLVKGSEVIVEGSLRTRSYDDRDGVKRRVTEVDPFRVVVLGAPRGNRPRDDQRREQPDQDPNNGAETDEANEYSGGGDDIPF